MEEVEDDGEDEGEEGDEGDEGEEGEEGGTIQREFEMYILKSKLDMMNWKCRLNNALGNL